MAVSRRALTEIAVGLAVGLVPAAAFGGAVYWVAVQIWHFKGPFVVNLLIAFLTVLAACFGIWFAVLVAIFAALVLRGVGESVCDALERRGVRLRPWP